MQNHISSGLKFFVPIVPLKISSTQKIKKNNEKNRQNEFLAVYDLMSYSSKMSANAVSYSNVVQLSLLAVALGGYMALTIWAYSDIWIRGGRKTIYTNVIDTATVESSSLRFYSHSRATFSSSLV